MIGSSPEMHVRLEDGYAPPAPDCRHTLARPDRGGGRCGWPPNCWPTPRSAPSMSCWWTWGATTWAGSASTAASRAGDDGGGALQPRHAHCQRRARQGAPRARCLQPAARHLPGRHLSGAPKVRAMEIIEELEGTRRGVYAGCVGYIDYDGPMDTCIAIRTIVMQGKTCHLQAGGGIVADSDPTYEFNEIDEQAQSRRRGGRTGGARTRITTMRRMSDEQRNAQKLVASHEKKRGLLRIHHLSISCGNSFLIQELTSRSELS
jgi:anthranilate synthase component 1